MKKIGADLVVILISIVLCIGFICYWVHFFGRYQEGAEIHLSFWYLPQYMFFSFARGFLAYCISFCFAISWGLWAAKDRFAEKIVLPFIDVCQSIPVLGFLPGVVLVLIGLFKESNIGLEIASILLVFTGQAWNMFFSMYRSLRTIPVEKNECATSFHFSSLQRFRWVELPFSTPSLIWNSIMSVAGGWFFLMITEAFTLGNRSFRLPGIGSYMSVAAEKGDIPSIIFAIIAMIVLVLLLDQLIWRPLVVWSQKFIVEETSQRKEGDSWFLHLLHHSHIVAFLYQIQIKLSKSIQNYRAKQKPLKINLRIIGMIVTGIFLLGIFILLGFGIFVLTKYLGDVSGDQWIRLFKNLGLTFGRIYTCVILSILIMLPLGLKLGLSEKWTQRIQPILQVGASFPASLLFPILIMVFLALKIPLGIGSIVLMLMGTQWYVLFNVMAGAKAIPNDLKEVAALFHYNPLQTFFYLYLPAIFPYLITGILTASGGAWNASIVAEYVDYKNHVFTTAGLGSSISIAAQNNDYPMLTASIFIMVASVALINYLVWLNLYHYSEKKFALNA